MNQLNKCNCNVTGFYLLKIYFDYTLHNPEKFNNFEITKLSFINENIFYHLILNFQKTIRKITKRPNSISLYKYKNIKRVKLFFFGIKI